MSLIWLFHVKNDYVKFQMVFSAQNVVGKRLENLRPDFDLIIHKFDISFTHDGSCIVSSRLKEIMISNGVEEAAFHQLSKEKKFYQLVPLHEIKFDSVKRKT